MKTERISINRKILGGKPCIAGTRIAVTTILELLEDGLSFDEIVNDYYAHITFEDVRACLEYAKSIIELEDVHFAGEPVTA
jgi:uncharacterized protein (DUF433 family)